MTQVVVASIVLMGASSTSIAAPAERELIIDEPRPVAAAVVELVERHGVWVSYEDPRYEYEADLYDAAPLVRKNAGEFAPGKLPQVLVPAAGKISLRYAVSEETQLPPDAKNLIQRVIDHHNEGESLGYFRLADHGKYLEVLPERVRDRQGVWIKQSSVLDVPITLQPAERNVYETLRAFCRAVSESSGVQVFVGSVPLHLVSSTEQSIGVEEFEEARNVLLRIIDATGSKLAWFLFYDPGANTYALNLLPVPSPLPHATAPRQPPSPTPPEVLPGHPKNRD